LGVVASIVETILDYGLARTASLEVVAELLESVRDGTLGLDEGGKDAEEAESGKSRERTHCEWG
jgi:hypothetical protein